MDPQLQSLIVRNFTQPSRATYDQLHDFQCSMEAWHMVHYLQDTNQYVAVFARNTMKYKCHYQLDQLNEQEQQQLLLQLIQSKEFIASAHIIEQHKDWLEHTASIELLKELSLMHVAVPISKYLNLLQQDPLEGIDVLGRLIAYNVPPIHQIQAFIELALQSNNDMFLAEVAGAYMNNVEILDVLVNYILNRDYKGLEEEDLLSFVNMTVELGEANIQVLVEQTEKYKPYLLVMVDLTMYKNMQTLPFWDYIEQRMFREGKQAQFVEVYTKITTSILQHAQYPSNLSLQEKDEFRQYRQDLFDLLRVSFLLLQDEFFKLVSACHNTEVKVYALRCVGQHLVPNKDYPTLMHLLNEVGSDTTPKIIYSRCLLTMVLSHYFKDNADWISISIHWIEAAAQLSNEEEDYLNASVRALSFLLDDAFHFNINILDRINLDIVTNQFQLAWNRKQKKTIDNFCLISKHLIQLSEFKQWFNTILQEMFNGLEQEPYCLYVLSSMIQSIDDQDICNEILHKVLPLEINSVFMSRFLQQAPKHANSVEDLHSLVQKCLRYQFKGQVYALEAIVVQGYKKCSNTPALAEWDSIVVELLNYLLQTPVDEEEVADLLNLMDEVYFSYTQVLSKVHLGHIKTFITVLLPQYLQHQVPEALISTMSFLRSLTQIMDPKAVDLFPSSRFHKAPVFAFSRELQQSIADGMKSLLPVLVMASSTDTFDPQDMRNLAVVFLFVLKQTSGLPATFKAYYDHYAPTPGFRTQIQGFLERMLTSAQEGFSEIQNETDPQVIIRSHRKTISMLLATLRTQRQWRSTLH